LKKIQFFSGRDAGGAGGVGGSGWVVVGVALDSLAPGGSNGTIFVVYWWWQWQWESVFRIFEFLGEKKDCF
jgi:hypothetical protein